LQEGNLVDYWSKTPIDRGQIALFSPTLDSWIAQDHPVRLVDEILSTLDWSGWEAHYFGCEVWDDFRESYFKVNDKGEFVRLRRIGREGGSVFLYCRPRGSREAGRRDS